MNIPVTELAQHGLIRDTPAVRLPLGAFTGCKNVELREGYVETRARLASVVVPSIAPLSLIPAVVDNTALWAICGEAAVYGFDGAAQTDITRAAGAYTVGPYGAWQGGMFNGFLVLNNGVDAPQTWGPVDLSTPLVDLSAWPASTTAKVVVGFKNSLIALNVTKTGGSDARMVKWSHPADPMTLPVSWDETDSTKEAGEVSLSDADDGLVDGVVLGDSLVLYTATGVWQMRRVSGSSIFDIAKAPFNFGAMTQGVVGRFPGGHFVVTPDDFVMHDLANAKSVATGSVKRLFRSLLATEAYFLSKVLVLRRERQVWVFIPTSTAALDTAFVWNWETGVWSLAEFGAPLRALNITQFSFNYSFDPWDLDEEAWDDDTTTWGTTAGEVLVAETVLASPATTEGISTLSDGGTESLEVELAREDLVHVGPDRANVLTYKRLLCIRPFLDSDAGTVLSIYAGGRDSLSDEVTWDAPVTFTVGTDTEVHVDVTHRFLAYKITCTSTAPWKLIGLDLDIRDLGEQL